MSHTPGLNVDNEPTVRVTIYADGWTDDGGRRDSRSTTLEITVRMAREIVDESAHYDAFRMDLIDAIGRVLPPLPKKREK